MEATRRAAPLCLLLERLPDTALAKMVDVGELSSRCIGILRGESVEHIEEVEELLKEREDDLEKLIAISHIKRAAEEGVTRAKLWEMREGIEKDIGKFRTLLAGVPVTSESGGPPTDIWQPSAAEVARITL